MVPARTANLTREPCGLERSAEDSPVMPDRSFKLMEDVPIAIHIPELQKIRRHVCHITVTTDKDWDQVVNASTVSNTPEPKEMELSVDQIHATSDKESSQMVLVSIAHFTRESAKTEDAVLNPNVYQMRFFIRMVLARNVLSMRDPILMADRASLTPGRSFQTPRSLLQYWRKPFHQNAALQLVVMFGPTSNSCPKAKLQVSTSTRDQETSDSILGFTLWNFQSQQRQWFPQFSSHWMLFETNLGTDKWNNLTITIIVGIHYFKFIYIQVLYI